MIWDYCGTLLRCFQALQTCENTIFGPGTTISRATYVSALCEVSVPTLVIFFFFDKKSTFSKMISDHLGMFLWCFKVCMIEFSSFLRAMKVPKHRGNRLFRVQNDL